MPLHDNNPPQYPGYGRTALPTKVECGRVGENRIPPTILEVRRPDDCQSRNPKSVQVNGYYFFAPMNSKNLEFDHACVSPFGWIIHIYL
jgi:hypothetical protein